jgi:hypothetical protein
MKCYFQGYENWRLRKADQKHQVIFLNVVLEKDGEEHLD